MWLGCGVFAACNRDVVVHFIGLGGIGMSGIAGILHSLGYIVQGSDKARSQNVERLENLGITAFLGHDAKNVENASVVVFSSAIKQDNPELLRARELHIPCLSRAEMLSQIVRFKKSVVVAGSHGKTTTTSICAAMLEMASFNPTVVNGGIIHSYKSNARLGTGEWAVIESDESDGSFVRFFPTIGIITNIDREHIAHYGNLDALKDAFRTFIYNLPFYGVGIICIDDKSAADVARSISDRRIISYSIEKEATFQAVNIVKSPDGSVFNVLQNGNKVLTDVSIPLLGDHNIRNSLAAVAMAAELGIGWDIVKATLASFTGVNRRFTKVGKIGDTLVIDDYAHHPTEILSLLRSARQRVSGHMTIICQPHRFTRLNSLFDDFCHCFDMADRIIIMPVYKADDIETAPITSDDLYRNLKGQGKDVLFANDKEELSDILQSMSTHGQFGANDIILFAGAGSISKWAHEIVSTIGTHV
ncbi:MAG: UDP-N-acetylmuramate--L-alanine ligase [Alphaproteobacteria bacterium]|nr:UDP-N-acetylmuramate--L-alanine ligase [Alphaproteobacteria bacterium]